MTDNVTREFPIRSLYFTSGEIQNIVVMMDRYVRLAMSKGPESEEIDHLNDLVWDTMRQAYQSLTEEL